MTYEDLLQDLIEQENRYIVMTAENRAALRNLPPKIGKNFIDFGIAEMTLIGSAAGLTLRGRKPITHALACFLTMRAFEFIRTDIGIPNLPVKMVGYVPGFLSTANGPTHQAIEDIGIMSGIPNIGVFAPSDKDELLAGIPKVFESDMPMYIRYHDAPAIIKHHCNFEIGKAEIFGDDSDVTIITYGLMLNESFKAKLILDQIGAKTKLINLRTVKPFDRDAVISAAHNSRLLVTIEDHFEDSGFFSMLAKLLIKERINVPVLPIAIKDKWFRPAGNLYDIFQYEGFEAQQIAEKVQIELSRIYYS